MEPRDPFLDRRVVAFCLMLPGEQKLGSGWPKIILRRAMAERLPDAVRWRRGKEHLGWAFTTALMGRMRPRIRGEIEANWELVKPYMAMDGIKKVCAAYFDEGDLAQADKVYDIAHLAVWLRRYSERPQMAS
jgi:asparagine synthase (glutamine-hydrolysing)